MEWQLSKRRKRGRPKKSWREGIRWAMSTRFEGLQGGAVEKQKLASRYRTVSQNVIDQLHIYVCVSV